MSDEHIKFFIYYIVIIKKQIILDQSKILVNLGKTKILQKE